jgi:uncharacterized cupin superfamily protein
MPRLDLDSIPQTNATGYPDEHAAPVAGRWYRRLAPAAGLSHFGASHVVLKPGAWSSQRHWHDGEDELLVMLAGEAVLVEDEGRTALRPGDVCAWPQGVANGHHVRNESDADCSFVVVGAGERSGGGYSDIDMMFTADNRYVHRDEREYGATRV